MRRKYKVQIPENILHPTNIAKNKYFDFIGFISPNREMPLSTNQINSGNYDMYQHIFKDKEIDIYSEYFLKATSNIQRPKVTQEWRYRFCKTRLISDHLPLWMELKISKPDS